MGDETRDWNSSKLKECYKFAQILCPSPHKKVSVWKDRIFQPFLENSLQTTMKEILFWTATTRGKKSKAYLDPGEGERGVITVFGIIGTEPGPGHTAAQEEGDRPRNKTFLDFPPSLCFPEKLFSASHSIVSGTRPPLDPPLEVLQCNFSLFVSYMWAQKTTGKRKLFLFWYNANAYLRTMSTFPVSRPSVSLNALDFLGGGRDFARDLLSPDTRMESFT